MKAIFTFRRIHFGFSWAGIVLGLASAGASAIETVDCNSSGSVFNTAHANETSALPTGSRDRNWQAGTGTAAGGPSGVAAWHPAWVVFDGTWKAAPAGNAAWISENAVGQTSQPDAAFFYRYEFNLDPSASPKDFSMGLELYADNAVNRVYVNGSAQRLAGLPQGLSDTDPAHYHGEVAVESYKGYADPNGLSLNLAEGWVAGANTLVIEVLSKSWGMGLLAQARIRVVCPKPKLTARAVSTDSVERFDFDGTNGFAGESITTSAAGVPTAGTRQSLLAAHAATRVRQAPPPAGHLLKSATCTGLGSGGTASAVVDGVRGGEILLDAAATGPTDEIVCTFVNTPATYLEAGFVPPGISPGGTSRLAFRLTRAASAGTTRVGFTETLPADLEIASGPSVGGTCDNSSAAGVVTAPAGGAAIVVDGLSVPGGAGCELTVAVTHKKEKFNRGCDSKPPGFTHGPANVTGLDGLLVEPRDDACLVVFPPEPSDSGARVATDRQLADGVSADTIVVVVRDASGAASAGRTVDFAATPDVDLGSGTGVAHRCITLPTGRCEIKPTSLVAGSRSTAVSLAGDELSGSFTDAGLAYGPSPAVYGFRLAAPQVSMRLSESITVPRQATRLTITLTNPDRTQAMTGLGFTLAHTNGIVNRWSPPIGTTCAGATVTMPHTRRVGLAGATLGPGASCTVHFNVEGADNGVYTETLEPGAVTSDNAQGNAAASTTLTVRAQPVLRVRKVTTGGAGGSFRYTVTNLHGSPGPIATLAAGVPAPAAPAALATVTVRIGIDLTEQPLANFVLTDAFCSDAHAAVTGNPARFGAFDGRVLVVASAHVLPDADILCTFTSAYRPGLAGYLFDDTGVGGGRANDGVMNGAEAGLPGRDVTLDDCAATLWSRTATDGGGRFQLAIPAGLAPGATLCLGTGRTASRTATGGSAGAVLLPPGMPTAAGSARFTYERQGTGDRIRIALPASAGDAVAPVAFGSVPVGILTPGGLQPGRPGDTVAHAHRFTAGTAGTLTFTVPGVVATPDLSGWTERVFADPTCSGGPVNDAAPLFPPGTPQQVTAGQVVCVVLLQTIPVQAVSGSHKLARLQAGFRYDGVSGAPSATHSVDDVTTVAAESLRLLKEVRNLAEGTATAFGTGNRARPGETLEYRISFTNQGASALHRLTINDTTPVFTTFVDASAGDVPATLGACTKTTPAARAGVECAVPQPAGGTGALSWSFDGELAPGATGSVTFRGTVD